MSREAYHEYLQSDHWKHLRLQRLRMVKSCELCGTLNSKHWNVHHVIYRADWHHAQVDDLRRMCRKCHEALHEEERAGRLLLSGDVSQRWAATQRYFQLHPRPQRKSSRQPKLVKRKPDKRVSNLIGRIKSAIKLEDFPLAIKRAKELIVLLEPVSQPIPKAIPMPKFLSPTECMKEVICVTQGMAVSNKRWMWHYTLSCGHQMERRGKKALKSMYCHECMNRQ